VVFQTMYKNSFLEIQQEPVGHTSLKKCAKLGGNNLLAPDFISLTPLVETVLPLPPNTKPTTMAMVNIISAPVQFPRLLSNNGALLQITC
jgi:hypothetical protein